MQAIELINKLLRTLKIPKPFAYALVLIIFGLSSLGFLYIKEYLQNRFSIERFNRESIATTEIKAEQLVKEGEYLEKKENEKEIRKILNEIKSNLEIYIDMPTPFDSSIVPKMDFMDIIDRLNLAIVDNTYNFSKDLRTSLIQLGHLLYYIKLQDEVLKSALLQVPQETDSYISVCQLIEKAFKQRYPPLEHRILKELENISY